MRNITLSTPLELQDVIIYSPSETPLTLYRQYSKIKFSETP